MTLLILGIILFIGLVVVHEWGHFIAARRSGVEVEEFSIFFPPRIFKHKTKAGWQFSIGALPLGGFVKMKGEHDADTNTGSFGAASTWDKTKIMAAGVVMNFIVAYLLLTLVALVGMPRLVPHQFTIASDTHVLKDEVFVGGIQPGSPADQAGLKGSDRMIGYKTSASGKFQPIQHDQQVYKITKNNAGQTVTFRLERDGRKFNKTIQLNSDAEAKQTNTGHLGTVPSELVLQRSTWSAPIVAGGLMGQFTALTFQGLGRALAGVGGIIAGAVTGNGQARHHAQTEASNQVSGPLGIYYVIKSGTRLGYQYILFIIAIVSLSLAIMNVLPIPALDGGRLWLTLAFRAIRRPLTAQLEETINAAGFLILIGLIVVITYVDYQRFF